MSRDFRHLFNIKKPPVPHKNRQKLFREILCFREDIREKTCVHVVVDYANTRFSNFVLEYIRKNE